MEKRVNLLDTRLRVTLGEKVQVKRDGKKLVIINNGSKKSKVICATPFFSKKQPVTIESCAVIRSGMAGIRIVGRDGKVAEFCDLDSTVRFGTLNRIFFVALVVDPHSEVELSKFELILNSRPNSPLSQKLKGKMLLVAPGYPSNNNRYCCAFIHTRIKEYKKLGWNIDVLVVNESFKDKTAEYSYEGVPVRCVGYNELRLLLLDRKYPKILVHFFSEKHAQVFDAVDWCDTDLFFFCHGADVLTEDYPKIAAPYFKHKERVGPAMASAFKQRNEAIKKYSTMENVHWVFVSNWLKERAEKMHKLQFKNSYIIPCLIDEKTFAFKKRNSEDRKHICMIRTFTNLNSYSVDTAVRTILELSRRKCFDDLDFSIYGDGKMHAKLLAPVKKFKNVYIHKRFLSSGEMADVYKRHGIALYPTRYDTQSVVSGEAAMSGSVVLTSKGVGVSNFIDEKIGTCLSPEDYKDFADKIEYFYSHPDEFLSASRAMHDSVMQTASYKYTIKKELELVNNTRTKRPIKKYPALNKQPTITVAIPSYNVAKYLKHSVLSLIDHPLAAKVEVLIVNDGSKDETTKIAKELLKLTKSSNNIIKFIDKENGGHGSTINKAIELATGKYFRLMDGDDYFNTEDFAKFVDILDKEDSDLVLTNYVEDLSIDALVKPVHHYEFMSPGVQYNLEDMGYAGYGFFPWGPLLSTSTYKTSILKNANFKLDENCFYVDMEYNLIGYMGAETVAYYPLDIYIYYLGRQGQSISQESYRRNYKHHEKVCLRLVDEYTKRQDELSESKKNYLKTRIINPMCEMQYQMAANFFKTSKQFNEFDKALKKYPDFYNQFKPTSKKTKLHKLTGGATIFLNRFL